MTLTLTSLFAINIFAINVDYTFNITDNKKWNLETGSIQDDLKFAVTSKMIIKDNRIITSSETYHHVVFWNSKNQFIGYKNSQYSILENDYYLGNIEYGSAGFDAPANAHFFSFMIYKSGNAINYTELGNQSLSDIFDLYNSSNLEDKDNNILDGYSLDELYNTQLSGKNLFDNILNVGSLGASTGLYEAGFDSTYTHNDTYLSISPSTNYYVSGINIQTRVYYYDNSQNFISSYLFNAPNSFTTPTNAYFVRFRFTTNIFNVNNIQLEKGSTATDYEPHASVLTREYFKDYEQIANTNYTELDNGRLRYVVNQDTISSNSQPLYELNGLSLDDVFNTGNNVSNGNYANNNPATYNATTITYSTDNTSSLNYSNNQLVLTGLSGGTTSNYAYTNIIETDYTSDFFIYTKMRTTNSLSTTLNFNFGSGAATLVNNPIQNQWYDMFLKGNFVNGRLTLSNLYATNSDKIGAVLEADDLIIINMSSLGIDNLTGFKMYDYYEIYEYFLNGGTDPQTFTYDSPIYYDITYRLDEQFNELDITAQEFIDNQDGYNRIINNEQANDFILYYAAQYAQDNNTSLGLSIQQWEQYYLNYLTFDDANSPFIASLNYNSLNDIFLNGNQIDNNSWQETNNISITNVDNDLIFTSILDGTSYSRNYLSDDNLPNDKLYITYSLNNATSGISQLKYGDSISAYVIFTHSLGINNYSFIYNMYWSNNGVSDNIYLISYNSISQDYVVLINSDLVLVNLTALGIDNLTKDEMDAYYNDYIDNQTLEQNLYLQALTPTSFDLIDPNYDYTAPPPDDFLDVDSDTFLDNLLTNIGFNNDLGKVTLSILILFLTTLTLIKFNLGTSVILGVDILVYVGLTFLGWLPAWINILIALIIMVLFYLRFKGGGSNNEESD